MLKIGDFSQLGQVSIKTLHYYDRIGLLKPHEIDPFTGYRYYTAAQLMELNRILALKDLGLSLDQIHECLHENISVEQMKGMLRLRQADVEEKIAQEQTQLLRIAARLSQLESTNAAADVIIKRVEAVRVMSLREILSHATEIKYFFQTIGEATSLAGIRPVGPCLALYYHGEYRETDLDVEVAIPIDETVTQPISINGERETTIREIEDGIFATIMCCMRSQADVLSANLALGHWIESNGYNILAGPCREVYVDGPQPGKPLYFEIQLPIAEA